MTRFLMTFLVLALMAPAAYAADTAPGASCTTAGQVRTTGGASNTPRTLLCNGTTWIAMTENNATTGRMVIQVDNDAGSCTSAKLGRLRYDGTATWEYCNGTAWTALVSGGGGGGGWLYGQ